MYQSIEFEVKGLAPLIMHNGRLANPIDKFVKSIKAITSKPAKQKTDADYEETARLEFLGSLYIDDEQHPCLPGEGIEAFFVDAAKSRRKGKAAKGAVICEGNWRVNYKGPKKPDELWEDENFRDVRQMVVNRGRVTRTRPIFRDWSCRFVLHYLPSVFNRDDVIDIVKHGGLMNGWFESRPRFGRFEVVSAKASKNGKA